LLHQNLVEWKGIKGFEPFYSESLLANAVPFLNHSTTYIQSKNINVSAQPEMLVGLLQQLDLYLKTFMCFNFNCG